MEKINNFQQMYRDQQNGLSYGTLRYVDINRKKFFLLLIRDPIIFLQNAVIVRGMFRTTTADDNARHKS